MTTTNDKELRELDAWIAEHVMGKRVFHAASSKGSDWWWNPYDQCVMTSPSEWSGTERRSFKPTEYADDAMAVLKKCAEKVSPWAIQLFCPRADMSEGWTLTCPGIVVYETTLELAICRFAQKLFSK